MRRQVADFAHSRHRGRERRHHIEQPVACSTHQPVLDRGAELKVRIHLPPAESRANFQPGWATKRRTSVSKPAASVAVCRRQVAWRHLGNPESKGRGRSSEVGDLHVQRGAKVLAGDKLPFIHLTELDIVKVGMSGGSNASGRSAFREETFAFGHTSGSVGADASQTLELRDRNGSSTAH